MLLINAIKIVINAQDKEHELLFNFSKGLNIIKGNNTSGKSTLVNTIFYSLGMEELLGGRNENVLPYALKSHFISNGNEISIISSSVYIEITNQKEEVITLHRSIKSNTKSTKLIEVILGAFISQKDDNYKLIPTYIHDPGSAKISNVGFFKFLEDFLGLNLPFVPNSQGGETKLYIQTIFSALFIEQKRGWTDYIANIPYFAIRNSHQKVFEYLLNFDVFANDRLRNELKNKINSIVNEWEKEYGKIRMIERYLSTSINGIPNNPNESFSKSFINITKYFNEEEILISEYLSRLMSKYDDVIASETNIISPELDNKEIIESFERESEEVNRLTLLYRNLSTEIKLNRQSLDEYSKSKNQLQTDIEKNKVALKIKTLGYENDLMTAKDICPTCNQNISDSLVHFDNTKVMSLEDNISYLNSQLSMVDKYILNHGQTIEKQQNQLRQIKEELEKKSELLYSYKNEMKSIAPSVSESKIREKIQLEKEIESIQSSIEQIDAIISKLEEINNNWISEIKKLSSLPKEYLSENDKDKIEQFQKIFRELSKVFLYRSTDVDDIEINEEKYTPFLSGQIMKREIKSESDIINKADIKGDSSASDYVRLIWSYLISLHKISLLKNGNHPGILIFDEPAQHSMSVHSFNKLLLKFSQIDKLQTIVAASFDESDEVFAEAVENTTYSLIEIEDKLIS